ncbi:hypothetical protein ACJX0J_035227, partial [Zea mays]
MNRSYIYFLAFARFTCLTSDRINSFTVKIRYLNENAEISEYPKQKRRSERPKNNIIAKTTSPQPHAVIPGPALPLLDFQASCF